MLIRLSRYVHMVPVGPDRVLLIHAVTHLRLVVDAELAGLIGTFETPQPIADEAVTGGAFAALFERRILTEQSAEAELAALSSELAVLHGRDPAAALQQLRRSAQEGGEPYWAADVALGLDDLRPARGRMDLLLFGDCDVQMESDFLRREAARRGLDLRVAASFPDDLRLAGERRHDVLLVGALRSRHLIATHTADEGGEPHAVFIAEAKRMIEGLRAHSAAPILIDSLPEPTVQPLGLADRGPDGHRNRFRRANLALAELVEGHADVHLVDAAAALGEAGVRDLLDDGQVGFTHFGSPGWMLQRPVSELAALHGLRPDLSTLEARLKGDPYARERAMAVAHVDVLFAVTGFDRRKCVIVDLDGVLWPGVLAETGAPFAWTPEISGPFSYVGLYFGLHEALLCLKRRGVLLACVSKNDEGVVRELWRYTDQMPTDRLLTPDDFVTWRVNWDDKAANIASIAEELGFATDAFIFIDDHPVERARVTQQVPGVEVWGEDLSDLRRRLLTDPRLQRPRITAEAQARTQSTKAHASRRQARAEAADEAAFITSLQVEVEVVQLQPGAPLDRVAELFERTTQFNTTGIRPSIPHLQARLAHPDSQVFTASVRDRFGDHGVVGAAVVAGGEIEGFVLSCRVLGLGVEGAFLKHILAAIPVRPVRARIVPTGRNLPVRNLYRDAGFEPAGDDVWRSPDGEAR